MSCDPGQLITNARCLLNCIPAGLQSAAQTAMLTSINGGETNLNTLMQQAKEYIWRVPPMYQTPMQIYLLLVILEGTNRSVDELLRSASCMRCIPKGYLPPIQTSELCEWKDGGTGGCNNPIVLDWLQRMADNGVTLPRSETIRAVCDFCDGLDAAGLTDKMLVVNPVIPDSLSSMRYPLIWQPANGFSPFLNTAFVAADLNADGIVGDAASKYFNTGFNPSDHWATTDSAGITLYEYDSTPPFLDTIDCGVDNTANGAFFLSIYDDAVAGQHAQCWDLASDTVAARADIPGFYSSNRTSNVLLEISTESSTVPFVIVATNNANQAGATIPDGSVFFMACNTLGAVDRWNKRRISFMAIHEGLTHPETQEFFDIVQTLRMQLGGGWV